MIKQINYKDLVWFDLSNPTADEIADLTAKFGIHPVAAAELAARSQRSKVDLYDNFIYLVLHLPNHRNSFKAADGRENVEVDFIIGRNFLVTVSYEEVEPMQEFGKILEANSQLSGDKKEAHAGYLAYYVLRHLYQSLEHSLEFINYNLKKAESKVFSGNEREMVRVLSRINRKLLDFRGALKAQREVLTSFVTGGKQFFGEEFGYYLEAISGEYKKVWSALESSREFFNELKQTNESMLSIKINESTKFFTMMAFITFPLTLIASVLAIRAPGTPLIRHPLGFWAIAGLMLALICLQMGFFKYKHWL
jgi:magnesium transporter